MNEYLTRVFDDPQDIDPAAWDSLLLAQAQPTAFMRHAYLAALHRSGSAVSATGWSPRFITLWRHEEMVAAAPCYLKAHSYGEYVFDWAWAEAYQRHGLRYYPKLLSAVPFTPVPGSRLLARDGMARRTLAAALRQWAQAEGLSSAHLLFMDETDRQALQAQGWMIRDSVQFHWTQDVTAPVLSFQDLLQRMQRHKRKNIAQERRRVQEAGVTFTVHEGAQIDSSLWDFFHHCYTLTYRAHGSTPYLHRAFFEQMSSAMAHHWLMFVAERQGQRIAASLVGIDRDRRVAWGRYWGCTEYLPCLHFEACYYQPLQWCIEQGFMRFEGGAQGEHKMARGLMPVKTSSAHWLADERFAGAVENFLDRERPGVQAYVDELREHSPFRPQHGLPQSETATPPG